ncbi:hypothetical protein D9M71_717110 [compost metagenome]
MPIIEAGICRQQTTQFVDQFLDSAEITVSEFIGESVCKRDTETLLQSLQFLCRGLPNKISQTVLNEPLHVKADVTHMPFNIGGSVAVRNQAMLFQTQERGSGLQ